MSLCTCPVPSCRGKSFNSQHALIQHTEDVHRVNDSTCNINTSLHVESSFERASYQEGDVIPTTDNFDNNLGYGTLSYSESHSSIIPKSYCESTTWECTICNGHFESRNELSKHAKACLLSELLYQCTECKQQFKYLSSLYDHVDETKCKHVKSITTSLAAELPSLTNGSVYEATLYFDGAAIPNPGNGGAGYLLVDSFGRTLEQHSINILTAISTKHESVYCALIKGLQCASKHHIKSLLVVADSELIINQMTTNYHVLNKKLISLNSVANRMGVGMFDILDYEWIPKRCNTEADALARQGSLRQGDQEQMTFIS